MFLQLGLQLRSLCWDNHHCTRPVLLDSNWYHSSRWEHSSVVERENDAEMRRMTTAALASLKQFQRQSLARRRKAKLKITQFTFLFLGGKEGGGSQSWFFTCKYGLHYNKVKMKMWKVYFFIVYSLNTNCTIQSYYLGVIRIVCLSGPLDG